MVDDKHKFTIELTGEQARLLIAASLCGMNTATMNEEKSMKHAMQIIAIMNRFPTLHQELGVIMISLATACMEVEKSDEASRHA